MGKGVNGNLIPPVKGEIRNPHGRPGTRNLSTILKHMLEDGELDWAKVPIKGNNEMEKKYGKRGWDAMMYVAVAQAMSGDIKAMEFLRRAQYGSEPPQVNIAFNNSIGEQRNKYGI